MEQMNDKFFLQTLAKKVEEDTQSTQSAEDVELSEEQLDIVSGGVDGGLILKP